MVAKAEQINQLITYCKRQTQITTQFSWEPRLIMQCKQPALTNDTLGWCKDEMDNSLNGRIAPLALHYASWHVPRNILGLFHTKLSGS